MEIVIIKRPFLNTDTEIALIFKNWQGRDKIYQIDGIKYKLIVNIKNQVEGLKQVS